MPTLTRELIHAAATDAGNRSMRSNGRTVWTVDDYNAAVREYDRLDPWRGEFDEPV